MTPDELRDLLSPVAPLKVLGESHTSAELEQALRDFAAALDGKDALTRAVVMEGALKELDRIKVRRPAALLDAALGAERAARLLAGREVDIGDPEPWPEPVNGAALLTELTETLRRYIIFADEHQPRAISLWVVHTHAIDAAPVTPRLGITSPVKRCGKTSLLDLLGALVRRPLPAANITMAALFRAVEAYSPTLLVDEADTFLGLQDELRGLLNAGHYRGSAWVIRTVGDDHDVRRFYVFAPVAIGLIGALPDTLADRAIRIEMRRKKPDEQVQKLRRDKLAELEPLRRKAARWAADHLDALKAADPEVPEGLHDRAADNWRPLLAIADAAGGPWPEWAREAARALEQVPDGEDADIRVQLLADLKALFDERAADMLPTETILDALHGMEDRPWAEWSRGNPMTAQALAKLLRPFGVRPGQKATGPKNRREKARGYFREALDPVWARYLPAEERGSQPVHLVHPRNDGLGGDSTIRYTSPGVPDTQAAVKPHHDAGVPGVPDGNPPSTPGVPRPAEGGWVEVE